MMNTYDYWGEIGPYATQPCPFDPRISSTTLLAFNFDTDVDITDVKTKRTLSPDGTGKHDSILIALSREMFELPRFCQGMGCPGNLYYGVPRERPSWLLLVADWLRGCDIEFREDFDYSIPFAFDEIRNKAPETSGLGEPSILLNVHLDLRGEVPQHFAEMITCTFPLDLSPTHRQVCASAFKKIHDFVESQSVSTSEDGPPDLYYMTRYWAIGADTPTHVFILWWYDEESERRFKDPELPNYVFCRGEPEGNKDAWDTEFAASLKAMEVVGMRSSSLHFNLRVCPRRWRIRE